MKSLAAVIEEIEKGSLYCYKEHRNPEYNFMVLYFSPDDYHTYVGFKLMLDTDSGKNKVWTFVGKFYVNTAKQDLFVDRFEQKMEISETEYQNFFKRMTPIKSFASFNLARMNAVST